MSPTRDGGKFLFLYLINGRKHFTDNVAYSKLRENDIKIHENMKIYSHFSWICVQLGCSSVLVNRSALKNSVG